MTALAGEKPQAPTLRPYQTGATEALSEAFFTHGQNRLLVKKPTGTGKTVWFASMLRDPRLTEWMATLPTGKGARMLVIAHREELLEQARDKIQKANPGVLVTIEQGDRHASPYCHVVIASIQTLQAMQFRRLKRLLQRHTFRIVIVDEAHHAAAASYRTALAHLGFLPLSVSSETGNAEAATHDDVQRMKTALEGWDQVAPKDRLLIGVTATPNRSDAIGLGCVFQTIAYSYGLKQAIEDRWLVPIVPWVIETSESLDEVRTSRGDFNQKDLAEAVNNQRRNQLALDAWQHYAGDRPTIGFTVDVQHAHDATALWRTAGVAAAAISGETPKDERRQILRDYTTGRIQVLMNCMVLTEGTDLPLTSCILHLKPTKSATLYEQMTGRGLRLYPGKQDCIVLDMVDVARRHSLQVAPVLYGLPPGVKTQGEDLRKTAEDLERLREQFPSLDVEAMLERGRLSVEELRDRASTFDVWTVPSLGDLAGQVTLNWMRVGDWYRVQYPWADGQEILMVQPDLIGKWSVSATIRPREIGAVRQRTLAAEVNSPLEALRFAEEFVQAERRSVAKLKDREAPWRMAPASQKQIDTLRRMRVPFVEGEMRKAGGKGRASDLLDLAMSRRGR